MHLAREGLEATFEQSGDGDGRTIQLVGDLLDRTDIVPDQVLERRHATPACRFRNITLLAPPSGWDSAILVIVVAQTQTSWVRFLAFFKCDCAASRRASSSTSQTS